MSNTLIAILIIVFTWLTWPYVKKLFTINTVLILMLGVTTLRLVFNS
ncbi:hypothetical protein PS918_03120 [Pseudomonas fluorescens]|uniref:Uncharacterized protein n=1 Tax=Pseudomonas fluorescens TaxID=294 RepID=A0A5E7T294_PSEFL|nr:hypothetical protein [Pseudomonas fluorescens]VVP89783.1 hypothetical protein PS918_03120 [Pseudomonas fluorescens]